MAEDIILLKLNSRGDTIQESSAVMTTADVAMSVNGTASAVNDNCTDEVGIANDSYA